MATAMIQIVHYQWDFLPDDDDLVEQFWKKVTDEAYRTDVQLYLRGRAEPLELYSGDALELRLAVHGLEMLMEAGTNPFISFLDEDGETVSIQVEQLMMIIVPQTALATDEELLGEMAE